MRHVIRGLIASCLIAAFLPVAIHSAAWAASAEEVAETSAQLDEQISQLIRQLGDDDYFVRERAQAELAKLSFKAFDALTAATTHEDLEIAARAKYLLGMLRMEWVAKDALPEVRKLLAGYELQNDETKLSRIRVIGRLPGGKGATVLCRLVRFEKSAVVSKHAAVELIELLSADKSPDEELARQMRADLGGSQRPGVLWLMASLKFHDDPQAALADWSKLVEVEHLLLQRSPARTSAAIVAKLVRFQIQWLRKLNQTDRAMTAMHRLVDLEKGNPQTLAELIDWLVEQQAWKVISELADRFPPQFSANPLFLYALAQAQAEQGDQKRGDLTAGIALKLNPGKQTTRLQMHYAAARILQQRGRCQWAEREYRHVIESGAPGTSTVVSAQYFLAEMLHDRGRDDQAAAMLQQLVKAPGRQGNAAVPDLALAPIRSRMNYFFACHFRKQGEHAKERQYLDKAIEADATDIDVLIACYGIAEQGSDYRRKIVALIKKETATLREQIAADPSDSAPYNQLAWLVGNTEGDFDEALKCSKKSIELTPDYGGYYDTLAHVYFGKGDYENALKTQTKAAKLDPHSSLIIEKLEVFRKKWEQTKADQQPK